MKQSNLIHRKDHYNSDLHITLQNPWNGKSIHRSNDILMFKTYLVKNVLFNSRLLLPFMYFSFTIFIYDVYMIIN